MTEPTFDSAGYPTDETLRAIREWTGDPVNLLSFCGNAWNRDYGRWMIDRNYYESITGGWSGNEDIIDAMMENRAFWLQCWKLSERGGRYVFEIPEKQL